MIQAEEARTYNNETPPGYYNLTYKNQNFLLRNGHFLWVIDDKYFEVPDGHQLVRQGGIYFVAPEPKPDAPAKFNSAVKA
jgi:hypothetical protein